MENLVFFCSDGIFSTVIPAPVFTGTGCGGNPLNNPTPLDEIPASAGMTDRTRAMSFASDKAGITSETLPQDDEKTPPSLQKSHFFPFYLLCNLSFWHEVGKKAKKKRRGAFLRLYSFTPQSTLGPVFLLPKWRLAGVLFFLRLHRVDRSEDLMILLNHHIFPGTF